MLQTHTQQRLWKQMRSWVPAASPGWAPGDRVCSAAPGAGLVSGCSSRGQPGSEQSGPGRCGYLQFPGSLLGGTTQ